MKPETLAIYAVVVLSLGGVILRPWRIAEVYWACAGALVLVMSGLLTWREAAAAGARGYDVYLFLIGMMLLSELARREGLFDVLAAIGVRHASGSGTRLFLIVYAIGTLVTVFMSNDATAVVLTPAVLAACKKARAKPLPYLLACALIANAASFVLPISNPANLVVFGDKLPSLATWFERFALPSLLAIAATLGVLLLMHRSDISAPVSANAVMPDLSRPGLIAAVGIAVTAGVLLIASAFGLPLGLPTLLAGSFACSVVLVVKRETPWALARRVAWSIVPLLACSCWSRGSGKPGSSTCSPLR